MRTPLLAVVLLTLAGCSSGSPPAPAPDPSATVAAASTTAAPSPSHVGLTAEDVTLKVRITQRQCFGSAGCNVTFEVEPNVRDYSLIARGESYSVTYSVSGPQDGDTIGTITLHDDHTARVTSVLVQVANAKVKLVPKVDDVRLDIP